MQAGPAFMQASYDLAPRAEAEAPVSFAAQPGAHSAAGEAHGSHQAPRAYQPMASPTSHATYNGQAAMAEVSFKQVHR